MIIINPIQQYKKLLKSKTITQQRKPSSQQLIKSIPIQLKIPKFLNDLKRSKRQYFLNERKKARDQQ